MNDSNNRKKEVLFHALSLTHGFALTESKLKNYAGMTFGCYICIGG